MRRHRRFGPKAIWLTLTSTGATRSAVEVVAVFAFQDGVLKKTAQYTDGLADGAHITSAFLRDVADAQCCDEVILAHTHPNGSCVPSPEDISVTYRIRQDLAGCGIKLRDHIIVTDKEYLSLKSAKFLD